MYFCIKVGLPSFEKNIQVLNIHWGKIIIIKKGDLEKMFGWMSPNRH